MTVYGNDWFLAPYDVSFGTVVAVEALVVADTFGQATLVRPAASSGWRMFEVTGAPPGMLVLPAVAATGLEGPAVEEVQMARDEAANLAWAVERTVTGPAGNRIDRHEQWRDRVAAGQPPTPDALDQETLVYRLAIDPPDHWTPLVPRSIGRRAIRLERGTVVHGDGRTFPPQGRLLESGPARAVRGGVAPQRAPGHPLLAGRPHRRRPDCGLDGPPRPSGAGREPQRRRLRPPEQLGIRAFLTEGVDPDFVRMWKSRGSEGFGSEALGPEDRL